MEEVSAIGCIALVVGLLPEVGFRFAADGEFGSVDFGGGGLVEAGHAGEEIVAGGWRVGLRCEAGDGVEESAALRGAECAGCDGGAVQELATGDLH